jgi:hypothetical protein
MTQRRCIGGGIAGRGVRGLALAGMLTLCGALAGVPAQAFEPPPGSKNFNAPSSVPNYFSNEAAPFGRGSQTAQPGADRFNTARVPIASSPAAAAMPPTYRATASAGRATYRSRLARGRAGRGAYAASRSGRSHAWTTRGSSATVRAQGKASRHSVAAAQRTTAKNRPRYAARSSGHAGRSYR